MSDTNNRPNKDCSLRGENVGPLPDKGVGTGMNGDTYGASLGEDATNRMGPLSGTDSDPADQCLPLKP
jgi:hypothetical protein